MWNFEICNIQEQELKHANAASLQKYYQRESVEDIKLSSFVPQ